MGRDQMKRPLFSCVMPVKGPRPFMDEALASLSEQGMGDDLEVVVQDGDIEPDAGQSDALNKGFAKAKGEWFFWLNADDVLLPGALRAVRHLILEKEDDIDWVSANVQYIDSVGLVTRCASDRGIKWMYRGIPMRVYGPSAFFRRDLYQRCAKGGLGFDEGLRYMMDIDLWERFRMAGAWPWKLRRYVWGFRVHEGSRTSGDLCGKTPSAMLEEYRMLDGRYGTSWDGWRILFVRVLRFMDGSYLRSAIDTWRFRGMKAGGGR